MFFTTTPAKRTTPVPAARTLEPEGEETSIPQWPAQRPIGAKPLTTTASDDTPRPKQVADTWETINRRATSM
ncbi:MAG: hypothetical protein ACC683_06745 [Acidimicrobiia bacterium]